MRACAQFGQALRASAAPRWLSLLGLTGTGKTHCAARLWESSLGRLSWLKCRYQPHKIYWPRFVSELRDGNSFARHRDMMDWPVLFLDDICAERDTTGFASEALNTLLGARMNKWTIITSNLLLEQIGAVDPRVADRMIRPPNLAVSVKTQSYALRKIRSLR